MENSSLNHTENHKTEEKETKRTPIKQRKKENEVLRFIREHIRYFAAGALVVVLILVLAMCAKPKGSDSDYTVLHGVCGGRCYDTFLDCNTDFCK